MPQYLIQADELTKLCIRALTSSGINQDEAQIIAHHLVDANLTGYHSHGVSRLPMYVESIKKNSMQTGVKPVVVRESGATALLDCQFLLGPVAAEIAFKIALEKAAQTGIGCVSTVNATYVARLGGYVEQIAQQGYIALMMANDGGGFPSVAPWNSTQPYLSTNPIAAGIPRKNSAPPIIIDIATASTARGKLNMKYLAGEKNAPAGMLIGKDGKEELSLKSFFEDGSAAILPLGGMNAGHKGFALSILVEILSGALGGTGCSEGKTNGQDASGLFCLVLDPEFFATREHFLNHVEKLITGITSCKVAPGKDAIFIPGERLQEQRRKSLELGIELGVRDQEIVKQYLGH